MARLVAAIALSRTNSRLRVFAHVLAQRSADVFHFFEAPVFIASNITFVSTGIDQFTLAMVFLISHVAFLRSGFDRTNSKHEAKQCLCCFFRDSSWLTY